MPDIETHPLDPFLPPAAKILMLGSFPPPRARWSMDFYYPNMQNDMWRIMGLIFFGDRDHFIMSGRKAFDEAAVRAFCESRGIAIGDTARSVRRLSGNASDKFLEVVEPLDLGSILARIPDCRAIITTGQKATDTILPAIGAKEPKVGGFSEFVWQGRDMRLYRMPSSSRAYPLPLEQKAAVYRLMFKELGLECFS